MPTPDPRCRPIRRETEPTEVRASASASERLRRPRPAAAPTKPEPGSKRLPLIPIAIGGGALVLGIVLFLLLRDREGPHAAAPPVDSAANAAAPAPAPETPAYKFDTSLPPSLATPGAAAPASASPGATTTAPAGVPVPAAVPAPKTSRPTILRKLEAATTAADAALLAEEAAPLKDADLTERCWMRVYQLDPENPAARTQLDVRALDPKTELAGFTEIEKTPQRVHLQPFLLDAKGELTRKERTELLARWETAHAAIDARMVKTRTEPYWNAVDELRLALRNKKFFCDLEYEMVESQPPYALFIEVQGTREAREKRRKEAQDAYAPFLAAYDKKIRSYLFPLSPKPPAKDPLFPVFVFLNKERYREYSSLDGGTPSVGMRAHYEPGKKQSFTYSPVLKVGINDAFLEGTQALLHELTHAWVDQLATSDGGETYSIGNVATHWFSEGIAEYMSNHYVDRGEIRFQPWRSGRVTGQFRPPGWRIPCKEALMIPLHGLDAWASLRVGDVPPEKRDDAISTITSGFYADMSNFILWLNLRSGANRPEQFEAFAREELAGRGDFETFKRCVPKLLEEVPDLDATIDDFVKRIANGKINPYKEIAEAQQPKPPAGK